jgi:hypothetical protein
MADGQTIAKLRLTLPPDAFYDYRQSKNRVS